MKRLNFESLAISALLALGVILRLRQYLTARSLWVDEAMLALNIIQRDFAGLFQPLDMNQGAPVGFLLIQKLIHTILGRHELVLRLFPFLAGIVSLFLFYLLAKLTLNRPGALIALALFAVNPQLIYYTSEHKQYSVDVAITLALLVLANPLFKPDATAKQYTYLALAGIFALWLSHPALFVLAGIGFALLIQNIQTRNRLNLRLTIISGILWLADFALLYFVNLRGLRANSYLTDYWTEAFLPIPPTINWLTSYFSENAQLQLGIPHLAWLASLLILAGWVALYREARLTAMTLAFIILFGVIASALHLYPVKGRLALFMIPLELIVLGKAFEFAQEIFKPNRFAGIAVTLALSGYMLYSPSAESIQRFITPKYYEHMRPYMDYLSASWKDGDALFVSIWAEPAFQYYAPFYKLEEVSYTTSVAEDYLNPDQLKSRFDSLIGKKRVWVLLSHVYEAGEFNERDFIVAYLGEIGEQARALRIPETSVYLYLYDLSR